MGKLENINTSDVLSAIQIGCNTMCRVFNESDNNIPYFGAAIITGEKVDFGFSSQHSEAHIPGRHLNALLTAENTVGIDIDEQFINYHRDAAFFSYSGPVPLPFNRQEIGGPLVNFCPHNIREGFHALYALVKYRKNINAQRLIEESIDTIFKLWCPEYGWNKKYIEDNLGLNLSDTTFLTGLARSLGPLVKIYKETKFALALKLAIILKQKLLDEVFDKEGHCNDDLETYGSHTLGCVMSSLAQLADLTSDMRLMVTVKSIYDHDMWKFRNELGWAIETVNKHSNQDRGEGNSSGDIVETAILLGKWGYTEYFHDAERILRCHILPSQLRDVSFITRKSDIYDDESIKNALRMQGAFGFPAPYGHQPLGVKYLSFNLDIVGGVVASLCEVYKYIVEFTNEGCRVNLLFDYKNKVIEITTANNSMAKSINIRLKKPMPLYVRYPQWLDTRTISIRGTDEIPLNESQYLHFFKFPVNKTVCIEFPVFENEIILHNSDRKIIARIRGDEVIAMNNKGTDYTFFDSL